MSCLPKFSLPRGESLVLSLWLPRSFSPNMCKGKSWVLISKAIQVPSTYRPGKAICWRHPSDWRLEKKREVPAKNIEDIFTFLPLPFVPEEFKIDLNWKDQRENKLEPPPYVHIKRNMYLFKRKRRNVETDIGCTSCNSTQCSEACVCRVQSISCSKVRRCSEKCANRPFRTEKKIKLVKTKLCGWGVVATESICKGDFVVAYVGEVIDDAMCEGRLWDMKDQDAKNFYMCEISKDFVIDAREILQGF